MTALPSRTTPAPTAANAAVAIGVSDRAPAPSALPAVSAHGVGRRFGALWALAHVDMTVAAGEALLVAGANGSGKTTLLRLLAGLDRPTRGELSVFGRSLAADRAEWRREVSLVSHESFLYDRLTATETVRLWARLLGRTADRGTALAVLERVGLTAAADRPAGEFSAGMRKRLSMARVELEEPRLVLLDEPFAALDPAGQRLVEGWIDRFRTTGRTVVMASHALSRASAVCDRAVLLWRGQVAWRGVAGECADRFERLDAGSATAGGGRP